MLMLVSNFYYINFQYVIMRINKTRKKIPSFRLSKKLISELCNFFTNEEISYDDKSTNYVEYNFDNSDISITEKTAKSFNDSYLNELGNFQFKLKINDKYIHVVMCTDSNSYFSVRGTDYIWVYGVTKNLEMIFMNHKTYNQIVHKPAGIPIYILCTFGLFYMCFLIFSYFDHSNDWELFYKDIGNNIYNKIPNTLIYPSIISVIGIPFLYRIFKRIFPMFEFKNKIKYIIRYSLMLIIPSLFITWVIKLII